MSGYYVDVSQWQLGIDWPVYKKWSEQWDGVSRVAMRSSYGVNFTDAHYQEHRQGALQAGIDVIIHYHYAYPQLNTAQAEAESQAKVVGAIRDKDLIMLDMEEAAPNVAAWSLEWLQLQEQAYKRLPLIYASHAYVWSNLQNISLSRYPLIMAHWNTQDIPACPLPYSHLTCLQTTDAALNIPGMPSKVDLNMWL